MNILCVGDIVGRPGRWALEKLFDETIEKYQIDFVIINAENAAGGAGLSSRIARFIFRLGCDVITLGDHTWDQKELESYLNSSEYCVRPANFPDGAPGRGWCIKTSRQGVNVLVVNLLGRIFMRYPVNCPFRYMDELFQTLGDKKPKVSVVDFHAETTSEKVAFGRYMDGKISGVFGTHTHIQTADEQVLKKGTAYITDLGMTGPYDSVIGQGEEPIIKRFLTSRPVKFKVAEKDIKLCGVVMDIDERTGQSRSIKRLQIQAPPLEDAKLTR